MGYSLVWGHFSQWFFHFSQLAMEGFKTIDEGADVEFELVEGERGFQAHNIVKL